MYKIKFSFFFFISIITNSEATGMHMNYSVDVSEIIQKQ
jgi:hypothetical protein